MPISQLGVTIGEKETLSFFDYNPVKNALEAQKSLSTTLNSVFLGEQHKVSSGDENVFWTNFSSQINYFPTWAGILAQSIPANQDKTGLVEHTGRKYSDDLIIVEPNGPISATNLTTYENTTTTDDNFSVHGVKFRLGQPLVVGNVIHYELYLGLDDTGVRIFEQLITITSPYDAGDFFEMWFDHPSEERIGTDIFTRAMIEEYQDSPNPQTDLVVYALDNDASNNWIEFRYRSFDDIEIAFTGDPVEKIRQLDAKSFITQLPTGAGLAGARQVTFGGELTATNGCAKMYADGVLEILDNSCPLEAVISVRIGRLGTAQISKLVGWMEVAVDGINFSQIADSDTIGFDFDGADMAVHKTFTVQLSSLLPDGTKIKFMLARDESGHNSGGLYTFAPTGTLAGLNPVPSAELEINLRAIKVVN